MGTDFLGVLLTGVLLAANAFFVGSEFALISARRDRLEALAEQGKKSAVTVIRAGEQLSLMLAGAQLGITICSILLGRVGEPAVAHLLEKPFDLVGIPDALLHTVSFVVALGLVVLLHVLLGEMVPKNIAIAGPERTAMLLIPAYLLYVRAVRPFIAFYNWCANITLRALRVEPKDELDITVSTVELSEMIAESVSEGLLDPEEHTRLTRALQIRNRVVADVAVPLGEIRAVQAVLPGAGPTVADVEHALTQTGYSRFPVTGADGTFTGYLHIKDVLALGDDPDAVSTATRCARYRRWRRRCRCPTRCRGCAAATATWPWSPTAPTAGSCRWWRSRIWSKTWSARCGTARIVSDCAVPTGCRCAGADGRSAPRHTGSARNACWIRIGGAPQQGSRTRCGTSCSPITACVPATCCAGTPAMAWCSPVRRPDAATWAAAATSLFNGSAPRRRHRRA